MYYKRCAVLCLKVIPKHKDYGTPQYVRKRDRFNKIANQCIEKAAHCRDTLKQEMADQEAKAKIAAAAPAPPVDMHKAALEGNVEKLRQGCDKGQDVKDKDEDGCTALYWAVLNGHAACVTLLLDRGANKEATNKVSDECGSACC